MLMASACSSSPQTESEGKRADDFIVSVDGIDHPTSSAQLEISFHSDGSNAAELSFQVDDEVPPTSAVLEPSLDQLRGRAFELSVINGPLTAGAANVVIGGEWAARGSIHVRIESEGVISGGTTETGRQLTFAGKALLRCMVPGSDTAAVPVARDDSAGEVLWWDAEFTTETCLETKNRIGI